MSSYLDISIERKTEKGWRHFFDASYVEGMELINCRILRDVFSDTDCYTEFALQRMLELTDETILNIGIKIIEDEFLTPIRTDSPLYPYKYTRVDHVVATGILRNEILNKLEKMTHSIETRFNDIFILIKPENVNDTINANLIKISKIGPRSGIKLNSPFAALQFLKYTVTNDWFDGIMYCTYIGNDGKEAKQYILPSKAKVSYYKDIIAMRDDLEKDIVRAKESMNDDIHLSRLLKQQTSDVPDNDWNTALGQIVQNLINENSPEDLDYIYEDLETLENQKAELDKLIMLTGENGRVIWSIS